MKYLCVFAVGNRFFGFHRGYYCSLPQNWNSVFDIMIHFYYSQPPVYLGHSSPLNCRRTMSVGKNVIRMTSYLICMTSYLIRMA